MLRHSLVRQQPIPMTVHRETTHQRPKPNELFIICDAHTFIKTILRNTALAEANIPQPRAASIAPYATVTDLVAMLINGACEGIGITAVKVDLQAFVAFFQLS